MRTRVLNEYENCRVVIIVMDSVGVGALPDAADYGDEGSNTLGNIARYLGGLSLPNMQKLGLGNIIDILGVPPSNAPQGAFGKMAEKSKAKDTTSGHWELAGLVVERPFPVYPKGFPEEIISVVEKRIGRKVIGNVPASGTEIIERLGEMHMRTGYPIVYTSADSVFQIACHEKVVPVDELYRICSIAREIMTGEHNVGRVIARPFMGSPGRFVRTERRRDFSVKPFAPTMLDFVSNSGFEVTAIGKIDDIFAQYGITKSFHTVVNNQVISYVFSELEQDYSGIIFANLVEFDSQYGHRNDPQGYAKALMDFDQVLPLIKQNLKPYDILIITADHGCDPTTGGTDHTREYVPLLVYGKNIKVGVDLGVRKTFADVAATCCEYLGVKADLAGTSFLSDIMS